MAKPSPETFNSTDSLYRKVYRGVFHGQRINRVTFEAESFFLVRLHLAADDHGNFPADPCLVAQETSGKRYREFSPERIAAWLAELEREGLVIRYVSGGDEFYHIEGFRRRQPRGNGRNGKPIRAVVKWPADEFDDGECEVTVEDIQSDPESSKAVQGVQQKQAVEVEVKATAAEEVGRAAAVEKFRKLPTTGTQMTEGQAERYTDGHPVSAIEKAIRASSRGENAAGVAISSLKNQAELRVQVEKAEADTVVAMAHWHTLGHKQKTLLIRRKYPQYSNPDSHDVARAMKDPSFRKKVKETKPEREESE